jgi:putative ABC transport system substrate-binding protein
MMDRRAFLSGITAGLLATPLAVEAQQPVRMYRIGSISEVMPTTPAGQGPFYDRMRELGWVYGRDFVTERRASGDQIDRIPELAADLMRSRVDVFLVTGSLQAALVQRVTHTVPIITSAAGDLVAAALATSLARPGGNITGIQTLRIETPGKHLSLLQEVIPRLSRAGILRSEVDSTPAGVAAYMREAEAAAKVRSIQLQIVTIRGAEEFEAAFAAFRNEGTQAIVVFRSVFTSTGLNTVAALALKYRLPAIYDFPAFATEGGLMSYGVNPDEIPRSLADITDKILRGAKVSETPIRQPTTFWLAMNMKTAKALGLTIPPALLQRADQVIE